MRHILPWIASAIFLSLPASAFATKISVVTLNVWDVGAFAGDYTEKRHLHICEEMKAKAKDPNGWDIVLIQELWTKTRAHIFDHCGYKFISDVRSAPDQPQPFNSLRILSRFPITETRALRYSVNGQAANALLDGDIFVKKGALAAKIQHPTAGSLWVFNTHLVSLNRKTTYPEQRRQQLSELAAFVHSVSEGLPTILGGDFNIGRDMEGHASRDDVEIWNSIVPRLFPGFQEVAEGKGPCSFCVAKNFFSSTENGSQRYDHIFFSREFGRLEGGITFNKPHSIVLDVRKIKRRDRALARNVHTVWRTRQVHGRGEPATWYANEAELNVMASDHFGVETSANLAR